MDIIYIILIYYDVFLYILGKLTKKQLEKLSDEVKKLRKKKGNLKCCDCGARSTPYVCITFGTFVCTPCSGLQFRIYIYIITSLKSIL